MKPLVKLLCLSAITSLFAAPLSAQEPSIVKKERWSSQISMLAYTGLGVKSDDRGVYRPLEAIYSGTAQSAGNVAFSCYAGTYSVSVALEPADMKELTKSTTKTSRRKLRRPDIKINGEKLKRTDWIYLPILDVYRARKKSTAAKFYNAVIRGNAIEMRDGRGDYTPLNLPAVDGTFKNFGSECGLGAKAKK